MLDREVISVTTDSSGDGTGTSVSTISGRIYAIEYDKGTFADGVDITITCSGSLISQTLLTLTDANSDDWYYPRAVMHDESGNALTGTAGGDRVPMLAIGKILVTVAQGGDTGTGTIIVHYMRD
jgi:hypothetical protein